mmetsp:Transcript_19587/g.14041  ORF Transcript_19587/g.14041 Transcript_19587/m.14041 type:complete len:227 (-) Transcript_19587:47-727(-)
MMEALPLMGGAEPRRSRRVWVIAGAASAMLLLAGYRAHAGASPQALLSMPVGTVLYGGHHWGGVGSEGYGTKDWDNTGWNAHYHPRDGASMDSESMEPYTWRKGPRVNDEYVFNDGGDPTVDPGKSWEPPIMVNGQEMYRAGVQSLASVDLGEETTAEALMDPSHPKGAWGTWVEPSSSARSVLGEAQYNAFVKSAMEDKGFAQSLAARAAEPGMWVKGPRAVRAV